jgi:hypothetical protein
MAMGVKVKICSPFNARLLLILLAAATVFSVFWFLSSPSPEPVHLRSPDTQEAGPPGMEPHLGPNEKSDPGQWIGVPGLDADSPMEVGDSEYVPPFSHRLVHLDLKGAPPLISYLLELFPLLKKLGATGILLEYEDTFPYTGELQVISAGNAYNRNDIVKLNAAAEANGLEIIPLVQTFGHLVNYILFES